MRAWRSQTVKVKFKGVKPLHLYFLLFAYGMAQPIEARVCVAPLITKHFGPASNGVGSLFWILV